MRRTKPPWLKVRPPGGPRYQHIKRRARAMGLHTVCEEARCPNIGECWGSGTATFMVMGGICTRGCRFCAVETRRRAAPLDPSEPMKLAATIAEMELDYVVITSVDRDDLPDQGASHFAACIQAVRETCPETGIEVLVPDFEGREDLLQIIVDAAPDVLAHNIECCRSLTPTVRDPRAGYDQSLQVLETFKRLAPTSLTKSSIMVGLGERVDEVVQTMADLRAVGTDFLTVGQYLQPTPRHLEVRSFVTPEQFDAYQTVGLKLGFAYVASGPLVRSSYRAGEFFIRDYLARQTADAGVEARP